MSRPHGREEPTRGYARRDDEWDRDRDRDDRSRGSDHFSSRGRGRPFRPFRPGTGSGGRSRTPSPRRFERERDPRDFQSDPRRSYGPGPGGPPRGDRRVRAYSPPPWDGPSRRASPPPHPRTNSPPRGPRQPVASSSYTPTPRLPSGPRAPIMQGRDVRPFSRDSSGSGGPGPSTIANQTQSTLNVIPPRAPRSMRGSSSPVETRNGTWPSNGSSSVPSRHIDLPTDIKPDIITEGDLDLEEGEVVSPVRKPIEPPIPTNPVPRLGDRWAPPPALPPRRRTSLSPRKQPFRSRPVSPVFRDRDRPLERDRGWGANRRTLSPSFSRPESRDRPSSRGRGWSSNSDRIPSGPSDQNRPLDTTSPEKVPEPRPPTPPAIIASDETTSIPSPPVRPNTPLLPEPPSAAPLAKKSPLNQSITLPIERPSTPELPPPPTAVSEVTVKDEEKMIEDIPVSADTDDGAKVEEGIAEDILMEADGDVDTKVEAEPAQDISMEVPPAPASPIVQDATSPAVTSTILPTTTTNVERVAAESPVLGMETEDMLDNKTPPVHTFHLPPATTGPTPPESATAMTPRIEERKSTPRMRFADLPSEVKQDHVEERNEDHAASNPKDESPDVFGNETTGRSDNGTVETTGNRTPNTVTIAERRAVNLPPNVVPPSRSHVGNRIRRSFPAESIISGQPSPRTEASSAAPSELSEEDRALKVAAAIKVAQRNYAAFGPLFDDQNELITAEVSRTAPRSNRISSDKDFVDLILSISQSMHEQHTAKPLMESRLNQEIQTRRRRLARLRHKYELSQQRWEVNHRILDSQMAGRPPMPSKIYEMILSRKETEELAIIDETSRNRNRQATQAQLEAVMEASRLDDELHPNRLADTNGVDVPDMLPLEQRRCAYDDDNDLVEDPLTFYDFAGNSESIWTDAEKAVFAKIFPNCQKQFGKIADKLPGKSVGDCVLYYYRTKKDLEWKREPAKGTIAAKKIAKPAKRGPKPPIERSPSPPFVGVAATVPRGGAIGGRGRGRGRISGFSTPGDKQARRKVSAIDTLVEGQSSETTSRAASETPIAGKGKIRAPKPKRPRESSVLESSILSGPTNETETPTAEDPDSELPTAKRGGKRRKVLDPNGQPVEGEEKGDKRRRAGQNSYWNNEEKNAFTRLSALYPGDFARIAHELGNTKTVKQVENWNTKLAGEDTKQPVPHAAGALDFYSSHEGKAQQPRLGTFPSFQQAGPSNPPRPGGMRISALLNDDSPEIKPDHTDAASDGTVEDDRPSSRNMPGRPTSSASQLERPQERYSARPYEGPQRIYNSSAHGYYPPNQQPSQQQPPNSMGRPPRPLPPRAWPTQPPPHPGYQQHPHPPPRNTHHFPHMRPTQPPPMGLFGHPSPSSYTPNIRTIYSNNGSTERERANPPKDKNRSEGPAFMGYSQERQDPPPS